MSGQKRKAEDIDDEAKAEEELKTAIAAAQAAPADEEITGLASGVAPIYFKVPGITPAPWEYTERPQPGEKSLVLGYLSIRGLGEVPRLLLAEAGAAYEHIADTMAGTQANSLEWRKRSPNGLMPMMSGLGIPRSQPICQSNTIICYLAKKYGMAGSDEIQEARIDNLFETAKDFGGKKNLIINEETDPADAKGPAALAKRMETMLGDMGSAEDDEKKMNYGQIQLFSTLQHCDEVKSGCVGKLSPFLEGWRKTMAARPRIAAYLGSPQRFPLTCNEAQLEEGGYKYAGKALKRSDFALRAPESSGRVIPVTSNPRSPRPIEPTDVSP